MTEEWRFAGRGPYAVYEVSSLGRVRSRSVFSKEPKILKGGVSSGYRTVYMHPYAAVVVHRLVAKAFLPAPPSTKHEINHIDGDRQNNRADNLEWVTHAENLRHSRTVLGNKAPRGEHAHAKLSEINVREIKEMRRLRTPVRTIAKKLGVTATTIYQVLQGKTWAHVGKEE